MHSVTHCKKRIFQKEMNFTYLVFQIIFWTNIYVECLVPYINFHGVFMESSSEVIIIYISHIFPEFVLMQLYPQTALHKFVLILPIQ
jgi:hypothetical protein